LRVGIGWDRHKFITGRPCILGGVLFEDCPVGPEGHSDGDAVIHSIVDALLGAAALGDIGKHFPDTNPEYADSDSRMFLERTRELLSNAGYKTNNIDVTVITEKPHLSQHTEEMCKLIADLLDVDQGTVSIKGTRGEGLGPEGLGQCVTAMAVASITEV